MARGRRTKYTGPKFSSVQVFSPPPGFGWPFATYPITVMKYGPNYTSDFNPRAYASSAFAGTKYFVNGSTGSNSNNGLTSATAVKSIWKATQLGNATSAPFNVEVAVISGGYGRADGFTNTSTPVPNTQPAAYVAAGATLPERGGIVDCWVGDTLAWTGTTDATYTTLYKVARSNVSQVINPTVLDTFGDPILATKYADAATADAASGSAWAQVGTDIYVKWANGSVVSNTNTRALLKATPNFIQDGTSKSVYLEGFNFQGGANGAVACTAAATMNFIAVNCSAAFAGDNAVNVNAWKLDYMTGLCALINCIGSNGEADGINSHWTPGGTSAMFTLTQNCIGRSNGRDTTLSCNGITSHDGVISIDIGGHYHNNYGANVIPINGCQMWCVGTFSHDSYGDVVHGGVTVPTDYQTQNTAQMWLEQCRSSKSSLSMYASNTSTIYSRAFDKSVAQSQSIDPGAFIKIY